MAEIILTEKDVARFKSKLRRDETTGCLLWTDSLDSKGYGQMGVNRRLVLAHRIAWFLAYGEIPEDKPCVLHNCPAGDNPQCCEPTHLWLGTRGDNNRDCQAKGRGVKNNQGLPTGVRLRRGGRYSATVWLRYGRRLVHCGMFDSVDEAVIARLRAKDLDEAHLNTPTATPATA